MPNLSKTSPSQNTRRQRGPSERLEVRLAAHHRRVLAILAMLWLAVRVWYFATVTQGPLFELYRWPASDSYFFDTWARCVAGGDWPGRVPLHPYHDWHAEIATAHFRAHPEAMQTIMVSNPVRDSSFVPGKALWNDWYGGVRYHQDPLYAYVLAVLYVLTGHGVYWMLAVQALLGTMSGVLLWQLARRYFGHTTALLTGIFYLLCGTILFQEGVLLRTSWIVFFTLLLAWAFGRAYDQPRARAFFWAGLLSGVAFLLQATFLVYLLGALAVYSRLARNAPTRLLRHAGIALGGFALACFPLLLRNAAVGAPLLSTSSVGAITYLAANVHGTQSVATWMPDVIQSAEIMGKTNGGFGPVVLATLKTHPSVVSYFRLLADKVRHALDGREWPNNENWYFYRELAPVLRQTFLDFSTIGWLGVAGLVFAAFNRQKAPALYLAIVMQVAMLLTFYILGRFRTPLTALLLPMAAYAVVECLGYSPNRHFNRWGRIAVMISCFCLLSWPYWRVKTTYLDPTDYSVVYDLVYYERIKTAAEAGRYQEAITCHAEFLNLQPRFVRTAAIGQSNKNPLETRMLYFFAGHYEIHAYLYEDSGNRKMMEKMLARCQQLKAIAQHRRK